MYTLRLGFLSFKQFFNTIHTNRTCTGLLVHLKLLLSVIALSHLTVGMYVQPNSILIISGLKHKPQSALPKLEGYFRHKDVGTHYYYTYHALYTRLCYI